MCRAQIETISALRLAGKVHGLAGKIKLMKHWVTMACLTLCLVVVLPLLIIGVLGLSGRLADVSYAENVRFAAPNLVASCAILGFSIFWLWWSEIKIRRN